MFSVENLYYILYCNLFKRINANVEYFWKFGSTDMNDLRFNFSTDYPTSTNGRKTLAFLYDQEPVQDKILDERFIMHGYFWWARNHILVTSEHSDLVKKHCKENNVHHIYYFFHGFACLNWYHDCQFFIKKTPLFSNKFLSFNRLCTKLRSYRLLLVSELLDRDILKYGSVSLQLITNQENIVKKEIINPNCRLSKESKIKIYKQLANFKNNLVIDKEVSGSASAHLGPEEYTLWQSYFLHVVSETVFFDKKLHLTEKIFKPIVSRRPFILLGAHKNLEYLKSYGFKTFSNWIDESYDEEPDNEKRLMMVCDEIEKIANLSENQIESMYWEMQEVLEHNFRHFFKDFKQIIVNELVDNFEGYLRWHNHDRLYLDNYDIDSLNLPEVKRLLAQ